MLKLIKKEFIFDEPTPVPECHASTILKLDNGNILAAWFGGTKEAHMDTLIWVSLRENGRWSPPRPVTPEVSVQHWNPVLFQRADGSILLFYKLGYPISQWHTRVIASTDGGKTWSMPNELVPGDRTGGRGPVKNKCLRLSDGRILAPGSTEDLPWRCFIDASDDDGETWIKRPIAVGAPHGNEIFLIQPTLWEHPAGHIHALMRSNRGRIFRSDSSDFGENWSPAMPTDMPNNNSGIDCVRMESGSIVLAYNPVGENWGARCPLSIAVSHDDGATFQRVMDIETEPCPSGYCYPAIVADGCKLYLSYTWNRRKIAFCELEEIE
jgi:predicted neuraminidase